MVASTGSVHWYSLPHVKMEQDKGILEPNPTNELGEIFSEFLVEVVKYEELGASGLRLLVGFQRALEFLQRPSIQETSELVSDILKANETKRVKAYIQAGCVNVNNATQNVAKVNTGLPGLQDHLTRTKGIVDKLEDLMEKAGNSLQVAAQRENSSDWLDSDEVASISHESLDAAGYASFMAVIYSMVKQDYLMQEKIVSSLSFKSSSGELDSYNLMWSLRPYVNDDIIHQALKCKRSR